MEIKGLLYNIQKFSLHDGPGIRTMVFFKGCPLRCKWCSNPESQSPEIQNMWDEDKKAFSIKGKWYTVDEVVKICMQDYLFYQESGGGVTLSGGEVMLQPAFASQLIKRLKLETIHIAIETTGYAPPEIFSAVSEQADLILFDVKHYDTDCHFENTGVHNELILKNLRSAVLAGKEILPRIPVIPDFNDSLTDAAHFSRLLTEIGITQVQLLPFHQFGEKKYNLLQKQYTLKHVPALHKEDLEDYQKVFLEHGLHCFF